MLPEGLQFLHEFCVTVGACQDQLGLDAFLQLTDGVLMTQAHFLGIFLL